MGSILPQIEAQQMTDTTILIVDKDAIMLLDLRDLLQRMGYQVVGEALDARGAIKLARQLGPSLVIMGVQLAGDMDGIDATAVLASEQVAPVLLLTSLSDANLARRAAEAGATGYLLKPFDEDSLRPAIEVSISRFRQIRLLENKVNHLLEELETNKLVERAKGVLMNQHKLTEEEALARIQQVCNSTNKSMRAVAEAIVLAQRIGA
jgi:AmiR/NasT family two-component response regulator